MKYTILYLFIYSFCSLSFLAFGAEEVKPRIAALASDTTYMSLLRGDAVFSRMTDSLSRVTKQKRQEFLDGGSSSDSLRQVFVSLEQELFELRNKHSEVANKISLIEQDWIIKGMGSAAASIDTLSQAINNDAVRISQSEAARKSLNSDDISALEKAETSETKAEDLMKKYLDTYADMKRLEELYKQSKDQNEGNTYLTLFDALSRVADSTSTEMQRIWSEIYDTKTLSYNILLESEGLEDMLNLGEQLTSSATSEANEISQGSPGAAIISYDYQKRALIEFETQIAKRLTLSKMLDSLNGAGNKLANAEKIKQLPAIEIKLRNFIDFEPITFASPSIYNKANPIPLAKEYEQGRYYRIQLGAFKAEQSPDIFKGGKPLSYDKTFGFWTYYLGCFASYNEAEKARQAMLKKGFKRPEIVVWDDKVRRNIAREPLPASKGHRVVVESEGGLDDASREIIEKLRGTAELSRISAKEYIISPLKIVLQADDIVEALKFDNDKIEARVVDIE